MQQSWWRRHPPGLATVETEELLRYVLTLCDDLYLAIAAVVRAMGTDPSSADSVSHQAGRSYALTTDLLVEQIGNLAAEVDRSLDSDAQKVIDGICSQIRRGQVADDLPWSSSRRDGGPGLNAFAAARAILGVVSQEFCKSKFRGSPSVAIWRGLYNELLGTGGLGDKALYDHRITLEDKAGSHQIVEGVYADPRGRVFSVGSEVRDRAQRVRLSSLACLWALSCRARAGQMRDLLMRGRQVRRWVNCVEDDDVPALIQVRLTLPPLGDGSRHFNGVLKDWSVNGLGVTLTKQSIASLIGQAGRTCTVSLSLRTRRSVALGPIDLQDAEIVWMKVDDQHVDKVRVGLRFLGWRRELYEWMRDAKSVVASLKYVPGGP